MIYRGPGIIYVVWFGFAPFPLPPLSSVIATHRKTKKERQFADRREEEGVGEEPNHTPQGSLFLYKSLNTLWLT
jgi:hypothetical protein